MLLLTHLEILFGSKADALIKNNRVIKGGCVTLPGFTASDSGRSCWFSALHLKTMERAKRGNQCLPSLVVSGCPEHVLIKELK